MTTVTMTKRGNLKVDGVKFYAVPAGSSEGACDCPLYGGARRQCAPVKCTEGERPDSYRLAGKSVWFISKERYDKLKPAKEQA